MNTTGKQITGAVIGAGVGWFIATIIADIIELKSNEDIPWIDGDENDNPETIKEIGKPEMSKPRKSYTEYFKSQDRPDLAELAAKYRPDDETDAIAAGDEIVDLTEDDFETVEDDEVTDPCIISLAEYANAEGLEAVTLNYYDDDVVTDQQDNPVDRPERILGDEALLSFGELSEDPDVVYVRNLSKKAVYEVVRVNKNYSAPSPTRARATLRQIRMAKKEEDDGEDNA